MIRVPARSCSTTPRLASVSSAQQREIIERVASKHSFDQLKIETALRTECMWWVPAMSVAEKSNLAQVLASPTPRRHDLDSE